MEKRVHGNSEIEDLYDKLVCLRKNEDNPTDEVIQHPFLKPTLRPYQIKAVLWMLQKEKKEISKTGMKYLNNFKIFDN